LLEVEEGREWEGERWRRRVEEKEGEELGEEGREQSERRGNLCRFWGLDPHVCMLSRFITDYLPVK